MKPLIYITRDIERALGTKPGKSLLGDYYIVTNDTPYARSYVERHPETRDYVLLVTSTQTTGKKILDTYDILSLADIQIFIDTKTKGEGADIVVFKNTPQIEKLAQDKSWRLVNPSARLSSTIESKISQIEWLGDLASYLPPHEVVVTRNIPSNRPLPYIIQWDHGYTGNGTLLITDNNHLDDIKRQFPDRPARVVSYIKGVVYTLNVVTGKYIVLGNISEQLTGISPLTDMPYATVGNDWQSPTLLADNTKKDIEIIATSIAQRMGECGWRGLFGIDVIVEHDTRKVYLLEINARQPASTTFESVLQIGYGSEKNIFECHIASLRQHECPVGASTPVDHGGQIVQRVTSAVNTISPAHIEFLEKKGYIVLPYSNIDIGSDLLRIQTTGSVRGMLQDHIEGLARL